MLRSLRDKHPQLTVEFELSNARADLLDQQVDVAVRMHPPEQSALVAKKVPLIPLGLFAHRDYLAVYGRPATKTEIRDHLFIGPDRNRGDLAVAAQIAGSVPVSWIARTDSILHSSRSHAPASVLLSPRFRRLRGTPNWNAFCRTWNFRNCRHGSSRTKIFVACHASRHSSIIWSRRSRAMAAVRAHRDANLQTLFTSISQRAQQRPTLSRRSIDEEPRKMTMRNRPRFTNRYAD